MSNKDFIGKNILMGCSINYAVSDGAGGTPHGTSSVADSFTLKIVLPTKVVYNGSVEYVKFSSPEGELMIYAGHERYICSIAPCVLEYKAKGKLEKLEIKQGFCKFQDNLCEIAVSAF